MPQWVMQEIGLGLDIVGFLLIVGDWWVAYAAQGRAIAWSDLRSYALELRGTSDLQQRAAIGRKMKAAVELVGDYRDAALSAVNLAATASAEEDTKWSEVVKSLDAGPPLDAAWVHPGRRKLMVLGAALVVLGFICQGIASWAGAVPFPTGWKGSSLISFDLSKASWLGAIGSVYDVAGAMILIRALFWAQPVELFRQAVQTWDADSELLRSQCTQKVDALWGSSILILGFSFQALSALGVAIEGWLASALLLILAALGVAYHVWLRSKHIRRWYVRAIDEATCGEDVKKALREAY